MKTIDRKTSFVIRPLQFEFVFQKQVILLSVQLTPLGSRFSEREKHAKHQP